MFFRISPLLAISGSLVAQGAPELSAPRQFPARVEGPSNPGAPAAFQDPFEAPEGLAELARKATMLEVGVARKMQALLHALFAAPETGGLGLTYDNSRTRTLKEAWADRKANCLTMTVLFVQACRSIGITARYAEPTNVGRWTRNNGLVRYERHLVATAPAPPQNDLVADFAPDIRRRRGQYFLDILPETRVRALWAANLAVERMDAQDLASAERFARLSMDIDPTCSSGWNTLGVINTYRGEVALAEAAYRKALTLDPNDATVIGNLETLLRSDGRWEEAVVYRQRSLELRKHDPYFQAFLAEEAFAGGQFATALKHINAAIKLQSRDPDLYLIEANCRLALGKVGEAEKALELARRWSDPDQRQRFDNKLAALRHPQG